MTDLLHECWGTDRKGQEHRIGTGILLNSEVPENSHFLSKQTHSSLLRSPTTTSPEPVSLQERKNYPVPLAVLRAR